jgi:glycerophosphoryl diester phosphodiesterase
VVKIIAHRGDGVTIRGVKDTAPHVPREREREHQHQCTFGAIKKGIESRADGVEFDVWISKDNQAVCLHYPFLLLDTGAIHTLGENGGNLREAIGNYTAEELNEFTLIHGEHVITLEEMLGNIEALVESGEAPKDLRIEVELKGPCTAEQTHRVINQAIDRGVLTLDNFTVISFEEEQLSDYRRLSPEMRLGWGVYSDIILNIPPGEDFTQPSIEIRKTWPLGDVDRIRRTLSECGIEELRICERDVRPDTVDVAISLGVKSLMVFTFDEVRPDNPDNLFSSTMRELQRAEAAGIECLYLTDFPAELQNLLTQGAADSSWTSWFRKPVQSGNDLSRTER